MAPRIMLYLAFALAVTLAQARGAQAQDYLDKSTNTFFIDAQGGMTTYKSLLVESNDTATTVAYGFGVWAGQYRTLGFLIRQEQTTVAFALNSSSIVSQWQDTIIRYRWGALYLGPVLGTAYMKSTKDSEDLFEMRGNGYGGNLGFQLPISKIGTVYLDVMSVTNSNVMEQDKKTSAFGARTDIDLGSTIDLTKNMFDFLFGYRYRTLALTHDSTGYAELQTTTYLGFRMGWQF